MNKTEQIEYVIQNWNEKTVKEMAFELDVTPYVVSTWANRLRKKGIDLPNKSKKSNIDWKYIKDKYK